MSDTIDLSVAAARHVLGIATYEERQAVDAAIQPDGTLAGVGGMMPSIDRAAWTLLEVHVPAIAHGRLGPEEGLQLVVEEVFRPAGLARKSRSRLGDSHDLDRLLALQDQYDDMRRYERRTNTPDRRKVQVDALVVSAAMDWVRRNASYLEL